MLRIGQCQIYPIAASPEDLQLEHELKIKLIILCSYGFHKFSIEVHIGFVAAFARFDKVALAGFHIKRGRGLGSPPPFLMTIHNHNLWSLNMT